MKSIIFYSLIFITLISIDEVLGQEVKPLNYYVAIPIIPTYNTVFVPNRFFLSMQIGFGKSETFRPIIGFNYIDYSDYSNLDATNVMSLKFKSAQFRLGFQKYKMSKKHPKIGWLWGLNSGISYFDFKEELNLYTSLQSARFPFYEQIWVKNFELNYGFVGKFNDRWSYTLYVSPGIKTTPETKYGGSIFPGIGNGNALSNGYLNFHASVWHKL